MQEKYICIRDCYHAGVHYKAGDPLRSAEEPNKHFALESHVPESNKSVTAPKTAGDDPRSDDEMRKILLEKYKVKPNKTAPRKVLFETLRRKEGDEVLEEKLRLKKIDENQAKAKADADKKARAVIKDK